ncbi:MAG: hypothetical protein UY92_C0003G0068 [Candidatus Magasanikbacteria bacterium GW2011_GWA2_56_11]|uniref:UbiA prenyltransferase n=1 Tax=Candidatus Magasanikbacteria bacterium GW2011_GWA2_56_11 TaxID=1619044 RepID=A0A0G2AND6_9BACT|nr:MAG: hypothetical protein UY92_C0003G0068 [Candidatus Magasanikbacteria bacterium GW2011_GWA2_56_11]
MVAHFYNIVWAWIALGRELEDVPRADRFRLWLKSLKLYLSILGFTDPQRPAAQKRHAMVAAVLTAIYDYDTDWQPATDFASSHFRTALFALVSDTKTRSIASKLFCRDLDQGFPEDGLDRGGYAFLAYQGMMGSDWLSGYPRHEIMRLGRLLQIVDDLHDLYKDRAHGDQNAFTTSRWRDFAAEARAFLRSSFYRKLEQHALVYRYLHLECLERLSELESKKPARGQFLVSIRPHTALFAAGLAVIGFRLAPEVPPLLAALTALGFAGVTASIMLYNDLADRYKDQRQGRLFASEHPLTIFKWWLAACSLAGAAVFGVAALDLSVAVFVVLVWLLGTLYSHAPRWCVVQNLVVALCSTAPALAGFVHEPDAFSSSLLPFAGAVFFLILGREILADIRDAPTDRDYKETIAVRYGQDRAISCLNGVWLIAAILLAWTLPPGWPWWLVTPPLAATLMGAGLYLANPQEEWLLPFTKRWADRLIAAAQIGLLILTA